MFTITLPTRLPRCTVRLMCAAALCCSACGDEAAQDAQVAPAASVLAAAGSGGAPTSAQLMRCSLDYAACLAQSPLGIIRCTEEAERCGLFLAATTAGAPAAGMGGALSVPSNSPTCALRIAECVVRDPFHAQECQRMPCDAPH